MAGAVNTGRTVLRSALRCAVLTAALASRSVAALGPDQPFVPPGPTAAAAPLTSASSAPPAGSGLTGIRAGSAPAALVDGQWVQPGQTIRGARLAAVNATDIVLVHADGRVERLVLATGNARFTPQAPSTPRAAPGRADDPPRAPRPLAFTNTPS